MARPNVIRVRDHVDPEQLAQLPDDVRALVEQAELTLSISGRGTFDAGAREAVFPVEVRGNAAWRELERRFPAAREGLPL